MNNAKTFIFEGTKYRDDLYFTEVGESGLSIKLEIDERGVFYISNGRDALYVVGSLPSDIGYECWLIGISNTDEEFPLPKDIKIEYDDISVRERFHNIRMKITTPVSYQIKILKTIDDVIKELEN